MAGKGGGSWKVAYADFVTAMMAFFLVMWIGSQDAKTRQAVANYFVDPSGQATKPARTGATFDSMSYGAVTKEEEIAMGKGRNFHTMPGEHSKPTKRVNDYLIGEPAALAYWKEQAARHRDAATTAREVIDGTSTVNEIASRELAKQMRNEVTERAGKVKDRLQMDLLFGTISEVNWQELAEDILTK